MAMTQSVILWPKVARLLLHPTKTRIIEALARSDRPLSPSELHASFKSAEPTLTLQQVNYHAVSLAEDGVALAIDGKDPQVRNAARKFYKLAPEVIE